MSIPSALPVVKIPAEFHLYCGRNRLNQFSVVAFPIQNSLKQGYTGHSMPDYLGKI
jgi:hypothetical protein